MTWKSDSLPVPNPMLISQADLPLPERYPKSRYRRCVVTDNKYYWEFSNEPFTEERK